MYVAQSIALGKTNLVSKSGPSSLYPVHKSGRYPVCRSFNLDSASCEYELLCCSVSFRREPTTLDRYSIISRRRSLRCLIGRFIKWIANSFAFLQLNYSITNDDEFQLSHISPFLIELYDTGILPLPSSVASGTAAQGVHKELN
jgi:hypothetical protein